MKYSHIYEVENSNRYKTANPYYYLFNTKDQAYLFTKSDLETAKDRAIKNSDDVPHSLFKEERVFWKPFFLGFSVCLVLSLIVAFVAW